MKEQKEIITGNRQKLRIIFCCLLLTLVCGGLVCAQQRGEHGESLHNGHRLYDYMLPEYELANGELYSILIDVAFESDSSLRVSDRSEFRPAMTFYSIDSTDYCIVMLVPYDSCYGVQTLDCRLTGFGVLNGDTVLMEIDNDMKVPFKSLGKKIRSYSPQKYREPFFVTFRMEGGDARLVSVVFEDVEAK